MIRLFLENHEIELNKSVSFAINKQFEDVSSPTDIKNDWSKTIEIPFSQTNNKIFGMLFSTDRLIVEGDSKLMGVYFDPYKKVGFRLQWGDAIIMQGYAKNINVVKYANGGGHYNITLNGELGKVFQEMKKITFDITTEEQEYLIDGKKYVSEFINKDLIYDLWCNAGGLNTTLYERTDSNYRLEEIIGFIPNNSFNDDFDYKTFQKYNSNTSMSFADVLDEKANAIKSGTTYVDYTGIEAGTVIDKGLLPREIGEYRSYMQIPYIFFNKLFQIFTKKTTEITGYDIELDESWFNPENPYWSKLVYILQGFSQKEDGNIKEVGDVSIKTYVNNTHNKYTPSLAKSNAQWFVFTSEEIDKTKEEFMEGKFSRFEFKNLPIRISLTDVTTAIIGSDGRAEIVPSEFDYVTIPTGSYFKIAFRVKDANGNVVNTTPEYSIYTSNNVNKNDEYAIVVEHFKKDNYASYYADFNFPSGFYVDRGEVGDDFTIETLFYSVTPRSDVETILYGNYVGGGEWGELGDSPVTPATIKISAYNVGVTENNVKRSNSSFILNDLWNNKHNVFDEVLNYCKQFRIGVFCDYINKKLLFQPLSTYFNDYKVLDWTNKLDMSKEYHIQPITFENKYVMFNYEKYETELNNLYNEKYGKNFGEYRLRTDYEFNTNEKELFKYSKVTIPSTDMCLSWENLYTNMKIVYTLPAEITAYNKNKEEKNIDVFGSMLFYKGIAKFDNTGGMRGVKISDDTLLQMTTQTYFYTQDGQMDKRVSITTYPLLDVVYGNYLCTFATPSENYTYLKNSYNNKNGIYHIIWEKYLNERYNKQNKIVTCYLRLTPYDIANFQYNNFVKIENQLYMVNKIYDYQLDENVSTKVDLITIQDIESYTNVNFKLFEVYNSEKEKWSYYNDWITLTGVGDTQTIYITSNTPITWYSENDRHQDLTIYYNNDVSTGTNGMGVIPSGSMIPVTFRMDALEDQFGDIVFTNGEEEVRVSVALTFNQSFNVYDSDRTLWTSSDKVELQNTTPLEKTIYITSENVDVEWSTQVQGIYIYYNNDKSTERRGSGVIPSGTMIPVTFRINKDGDVSAINGTIRFRTNVQYTDIPIRIIYNEVFTLYRWDGAIWNEVNDYILLDSTDQIKTIYITANSNVEWSDESAELQNLYINAGGDEEDWGEYENGSGIIYAPSNMKPIHFRLDTEGMETGSSGNVVFFNGRHEWRVGVRLA